MNYPVDQRGGSGENQLANAAPQCKRIPEMGKYTRKNSTGDAGEYLVGYVFAGKLGWAYRILDSDTGIDGEVEVYNGEEPTGRLLKVQVKSTAQADAIVKNEGAAGEVAAGFSVQLKKPDVVYWKTLALPVILCVAHIETAKVYYRIIDSTVTIPDGPEATFSLEIPSGNELNEAAREPLTTAAPLRDFNPLTRLLEQTEVMIERLGKASPLDFAFDKGVAIHQLKKQAQEQINSIKALTALGGWMLGEATQDRVNELIDILWMEVQRIDLESSDWERG